MNEDIVSFYWLEFVWLQSKKALKNILQKCVHLPALEPLLHDAPPNILKHVVGQFSKVLPHDSKARRLFVTSAGLKKIQEIKAEPGSALAEYINTINNCYPEEIVKYVVVYCVLTWSNCLFLFLLLSMKNSKIYCWSDINEYNICSMF